MQHCGKCSERPERCFESKDEVRKLGDDGEDTNTWRIGSVKGEPEGNAHVSVVRVGSRVMRGGEQRCKGLEHPTYLDVLPNIRLGVDHTHVRLIGTPIN